MHPHSRPVPVYFTGLLEYVCVPRAKPRPGFEVDEDDIQHHSQVRAQSLRRLNPFHSSLPKYDHDQPSNMARNGQVLNTFLAGLPSTSLSTIHPSRSHDVGISQWDLSQARYVRTEGWRGGEGVHEFLPLLGANRFLFISLGTSHHPLISI